MSENNPPLFDLWGANPPVYQTHVTLRDLFAAAALVGLMGKLPLFDRQGEHGLLTPSKEMINQVRLDLAESAYDYADAMLAERARVPLAVEESS